MTKCVSGRVLDIAALTNLLRQGMEGLRETPHFGGRTVNAPFQNRVLVLMGEYGKYEPPRGVTYVVSERTPEANRFLRRFDVPPQFAGMPAGSMALSSHTLIELTMQDAKLIELDSLGGGVFPALEMPLSKAKFCRPRGGTGVRTGSYIVKFSLGLQRELWLYQAETLPRKPEDIFDQAWRLGVGGAISGVSTVPHSSLQIPRFDATVFGSLDELTGLSLGLNEANHAKRVGQVVELATLRIESGASKYVARDANKPLCFNGPMVAFTTLPAGRGRIIGTVIVIENPASLA